MRTTTATLAPEFSGSYAKTYRLDAPVVDMDETGADRSYALLSVERLPQDHTHLVGYYWDAERRQYATSLLETWEEEIQDGLALLTSEYLESVYGGFIIING